MKKSELKEYIKEKIIKTLSEASAEEVQNQKDLNKELEKTKALTTQIGLNEKEDDDVEVKDDYYKVEDEDGDRDKEPSQSDLKKDAKATKGMAKAKDELAMLTREMKALARKYKEAEGAAKDKIVADLKAKTKLKKELEAILDK